VSLDYLFTTPRSCALFPMRHALQTHPRRNPPSQLGDPRHHCARRRGHGQHLRAKPANQGPKRPVERADGDLRVTRGDVKRRGHHDALQRPTSDAGLNCTAALLFRRTYGLTGEQRWRGSIGDSPRYLLQSRLERGTVETDRPRASSRSGGAPGGHGRVATSPAVPPMSLTPVGERGG
jgi:hypothetical protein